MKKQDIERSIHIELSEKRRTLPQDFQEEFSKLDWQLVTRPEGQRVAQREHCLEMKEEKEGRYAWYLQGNLVGEVSARSYRNTRSKIAAPEVGDGAGDGKGFVEMFQPGDRIIVWGRVKVNLVIFLVFGTLIIVARRVLAGGFRSIKFRLISDSISETMLEM
jgi:hypothetical protein